MPLVTTRVDISTDFGRITREVNDLAKRAVTVAANQGAHAASNIAATRGLSAMRVEGVRGTPDGWACSFISPDAHAWYQNYGTLGNRRKKLKQAPRTNRTRAPGTGIEPLKFLDAGRRVGRAAMLGEIARGL